MPIQGLQFTIPNNTEQHQSYQATGSFVVYNPNDGVCFVATDRTANLQSWDYKIPSQSGGKFPGPINSYLSLYFQDQSGAASTSQIVVYASMDKVDIPHFWSIGRALLTAGSTLDINTGNQPNNPPANTVRLWADGNGDLHILSATGSDNLVYDSSNIGTVALGGDLYGTISNAHINLQWGQIIQAHDPSGNSHSLIGLIGAGDTAIWNAHAGFIYFLAQNGAGIGAIDNTGNVSFNASGSFGGSGSFAGTLKIGNSGVPNQNGDIGLSRNASPATGAIYFGSGGGNWIYYDGSGSFQLTNTIHAGGHVYADNGYLWTTDGGNGIVSSSNGSLYVRASNGNIIIDGGGGLNISNGGLNVRTDITVHGGTGVTVDNGVYSSYLQAATAPLGTGAGSTALNERLSNTQGNFMMQNFWWYRVAAGSGWPTVAAVWSYDVDGAFNLAGGCISMYGGNIGIGTYTPTGAGDRLQVNGNISASSGTIHLGGGTLTFNGTYMNMSHSIQFNTTGNQVNWPNGSYISGNAGYVQGSQADLKEDIISIPDVTCLAQVIDPRMGVIGYHWPEDTRKTIGFTAESVDTVMPDVAIHDENGIPVGYSPAELTAILWGAVREIARSQNINVGSAVLTP